MRPVALLLLFLYFDAFAQKSEAIHLDNLPQQGIVLDTGWRWHEGNNPDWIDPAFDDALWETINPAKNIADLPQIEQAEMVCLRLRLWIDSALMGKAFALQIWQGGASEIYLNGGFIHQAGHVSNISREERTYLTNGYPYSITFSKPGEQVIAVRYSFTKSNALMRYRARSFPCFRIELSHLDKTVKTYLDNKGFDAFLSHFKFGVLLFLGLLHLFFFVSYRKQNVNLFISLYALCQACAYYLDHENSLPIDGSSFYLNFLYFFIFSVFSGIFSLLIVYSYLRLPKGAMFRLMFVLILLSYSIWLYAPYFGGYFYNMFGIAGILAFEAIRVSLKTIRKNNSGAKYIIAGWVVSIFFMAITYFMIFDLLPSNKYSLAICINLGLLSVPICYSLMLAGDYARISKSLVAKLKEVETLSAEKQQLLAIQNETLEKQVKERTAELHQSLTELKSTQTQLIQSEKLASLGELTAGIAHEIQNPLNFVNNFSEISVELAQELGEEVKKSDLDKDVVHGLVGDLSQNQIKINHHGKRAASIVTGMLQHARAGTGKKEPTDLNAFADEYLRLAYHGLRAKDPNFNAKMVTDFDPAIGKVEVIPQDMGRVLLNLINNAFYAVMQRAGANVGVASSHPDTLRVEAYEPTVTVSTQQTDNQIIIKVKDNGTGIPADVKAKIFQPFFTTKPTGQGTGLGLSLAYDIVTKGHGGTLEVESAEGEGTVFVIQLPLNQNV